MRRMHSCRSSLEQLLKENYLTPGGEENIKCFFREEGFQTGISNMLKVVLFYTREASDLSAICPEHMHAAAAGGLTRVLQQISAPRKQPCL